MKNMSIGRIRHVLQIQETVTVDDGGGGETVTWPAIAPLPDIQVGLLSLTSEEQFRYAQTDIQVTHQIVTRYRADIHLEHRLFDSDQNIGYRIVRIEPLDDRKRFIKCLLLNEE